MKDGGKIERRKELHENQQERMPRREERRKQEGKSPSEFGRRRGIKIDGRKKEEGITGRDRPKKKNDHGWLAPGVLKQLTRSLPPPCLSLSPEEEGGRRCKAWLLLLENTRCRPPDLIMAKRRGYLNRCRNERRGSIQLQTC